MPARFFLWLLLVTVSLFPRPLVAQVSPPSGGGVTGATFPVTTCVNTVGVGLTAEGLLTCAPVTPAMTTGLVPSGADLNALGQVTATHLATPLPLPQGGLGLTAGNAGGILYFASPLQLAASPVLVLNAPLFGGGDGAPPSQGTRSGTTLEVATVLGPHTLDKQLAFDANGNIVATAADIGGSAAGAVTSVFGRTGAVVAQPGDYTAAQVTNAASLLTANIFTHPSGQTMSQLVLPGNLSGSVSLRAASIAGNSLITLPPGTLDFTATGGPGQVVKQLTTGGGLSVGTLAFAELTGTATAVQVPSLPDLLGVLPVSKGGLGWSDTTVSGTTHILATVSGLLTSGKQLGFDTNGNIVATAADIGGGGGGSGTITPGTAGILAVYPSNGTTLSQSTLAAAEVVVATNAFTTPARLLQTAGAGRGVTESSILATTVCTTTGICAGYQAALGFTAVPTTRTVNGHALSADVMLTKADVGLTNVTDDAQLKRAAGDFGGFTAKVTPEGADVVLLEDSGAAGAKKKVTLASLSTAVIPNDSVTMAQLVNIPTASVLGRSSAGAGDPEVLSVAQTKALLLLDAVTNDAQLKRAANDFGSFTAKATPEGADVVLVEDSAAAGAKKKITLGSLASAVIPDNSITLAKLDAIPTGSLLGRSSAGTGDPEVLSVAQTKAMLLLDAVTNDAQLRRAANDFGSFATKALPDTSDVLLIEDSTAAGVKKKVTIGSFPAVPLADNSVTLAKLPDIATASFLGRTSAGTGDPEVLSAGQAKALLVLSKADVGLASVTDDAQLKRSANDFGSFTVKATPEVADVVLVEDSGAAGAKKKVTVGSLPGATIPDNSITLAKLTNIATASLLGRTTAGTGDPEVLSVAQTKTLLLLDALTNDAQLKRSANDFGSFTTKALPDTSDVLLIEDSTAAGAKKKVTIGSFPAVPIADNSVTLAKLPDIATASFLGRTTAGTGDPEVLSVAQAKALLALTKTDVGLASVTDDPQLKRSANDFGSFTAKATPEVADVVLIEDSAGAGAKKKITLGSLPGATIPDNAVTLAKLADIATASLLGRTSAGAGDPEVLSVSQVRTLLALDAVSNDAQLKRSANDFGSFTTKTVPDTSDVLLIEDSTAAGVKKKVTLGSFPAATIPDDSVTLAKLANITTASLLGRASAGTGDPEVLSAAQAKAVLALTKADVGLTSVTDDPQLKRSANDFGSFTVKGTPAGADLILIEDSAAGGAKKQIAVSSLPGGTIPDNAVTLAKLADIATASLLGRLSGGTGDPEVLSAGQARTVLALDAVTNDAQLKRGANDFGSFATKGTPDGADVFLLEDSAAGGAKKKVTLASLPAASIPDNAVTLAKLADMATASLLGRATAGTGDPEVLSAGQARTLLLLDAVTNDAQLKRSANDFGGFTVKGTPVGADILLIEDSAAGWAKKQITVSSLPGGSGGALADNSVTLAKMADMAPDFLIGRFTGGSGDPEYLSDTQVKAILDLGNVDNTSDATKNTQAATLTNKLIVPRSLTPTVTANAITPDLDLGDVFILSTIAADLTINDPIGTGGKPYPEQEVSFRFTSSTPRALLWGSAFSAENGIPLPTSTAGDGVTTDRFKFIRNSTSGKYGLVATTQGVTRGVTTLASSTTLTCNAQIASQCQMAMTGAAGTITIAAPTGGTPTNGTKLKIDLMCTNAQTLSFNAIFIASPNIPLPTTGGCPADTTKWTMLGFEYSTTLTRYQLIATN